LYRQAVVDEDSDMIAIDRIKIQRGASKYDLAGRKGMPVFFEMIPQPSRSGTDIC
jgi:hypothetical protein